MCLWLSTKLNAMCPRWTLLAAASHLECKYLHSVCVCVCLFAFIDPVVCHEHQGQKRAQLQNYCNMSLTTGSWQCWLYLSPSQNTSKMKVSWIYLSHPNKSSHRTWNGCETTVCTRKLFRHLEDQPGKHTSSPSHKEALPEMINWLEQMAPPSPIGKLVRWTRYSWLCFF